jgi:Trp operon repressor
MEHLSSAMEQQQHQEYEQQQVQWRRDKVQELCSKGYSQREISHILQIGLATVNRDVSYLRNQAKTNIKKYIDEKMTRPKQENQTLFVINLNNPEGTISVHTFLLCFELVFVLSVSFVVEVRMYWQLPAFLFLQTISPYRLAL